MPTAQEVARDILAAVGTDAGHVLAAKWVSDRYVELVSKVKFRHLRQLGEVIVPATITAGTVTLTQGSTTVTPDGAALTAWTLIANDGLVGRSFRAQDNEWYVIDTFDGSVLRLRTPRVEASVAGSGYAIAARAVALAPRARWIGDDMVHMRLRHPVTNMSLALLDLGDPTRQRASSPPSTWSEIGRTPAGAKLAEFYPYPSQDELIHYVYWLVPPPLGFDDELPQEIDGYVLREGGLIDAMRYEAAQAARKGAMDAAAYWRNEYRAQETKWSQYIRDAVRTDRGVDDVSFILSGYGSGWSAGNRDIMTAHDLVWNRWP
jgi:hypothetical protein